MQDNIARGILLLLGTMVIIGTMDALSKLLVTDMAVGQILAVRYWMFFCVAAWMAHRSIGLRRAYASKRPWVQIARSVILMVEMALFIQAFAFMHLADVHAIAAARASRAQACTLHVDTENEAAKRLYGSAGFRVTGERRDYYRPGRHAHAMELELAS